MLDPHLIELMNKSSTDESATPFDLALDKIIKDQVNALMEKDTENKLLSPELRRTKIEQEVRNEIGSNNSSDQVLLAVKILLDEGSLREELVQMGSKLNALREFDADNLQEALKLPDECGQSILKVAIDKYNQGLLDDSLALFHFLTIVNPKEADYWYRYGLIAEKCEKYPLALIALNTTTALAPDFIGGHIYLANCHMKMNAYEEAKAELASAKKIMLSSPVDEEWKEHINQMEDYGS